MARRDTNGLFHPWLPPRERRSPSLRQCRVCRPRRSEWLDDRVVHPSVVPLRERCPAYRLDWPPHVERPVTGLLPEQRTNRNGRVPRWFVWWKLYELQDQRCAVCDWAPQVIDHDHESLLVRGLLCRDCNAREASSLAGTRVCVHAPPYCFEEYRASPPGEAFAWFWPATSGPPPSFLLLPL
ncbi:MAG: hypothetical protein HOV68_09830 [Streptomycetaceae bacterium]|nr:hypothetical protein [Streptomycetaceae bacterium]